MISRKRARCLHVEALKKAICLHMEAPFFGCRTTRKNKNRQKNGSFFEKKTHRKNEMLKSKRSLTDSKQVAQSCAIEQKNWHKLVPMPFFSGTNLCQKAISVSPFKHEALPRPPLKMGARFPYALFSVFAKSVNFPA